MRQGKGEQILWGENQMKLVLWLLKKQQYRIQEAGKKGKGCNLHVKDIKVQEVCGEIWIIGHFQCKKNKVFTWEFGDMFNLRIRERFLTTRARDLWSIFPVNLHKTTKILPSSLWKSFWRRLSYCWKHWGIGGALMVWWSVIIYKGLLTLLFNLWFCLLAFS